MALNLQASSRTLFSTKPVQCRASRCSRSKVVCASFSDNATKVGAALAASAIIAGSASAISFDDLQGLTYLQVKGTGIANTCPTIVNGSSDLSNIKPGNYNLEGLCLEPVEFSVLEEGVTKDKKAQYAPTKLMTRLTYTLDQITGDFSVGASGDVKFKEKDGIDFAPVTVQLSGGERVAFLFTIKDFNATGDLKNGFKGDFTVPSYRGSSFLDPKGRGGSTGYDTAVALPAKSDADELQKENVKSTKALSGSAVFSVATVDPSTNEIGGVFTSTQPGDTDLGAKTPKQVKIKGIWYARLS